MKKYFLIMLVVIVGLSLTGVVSAWDDHPMKGKWKKNVSKFKQIAYVLKARPNDKLDQEAEEFCEEEAPFAHTGSGGQSYYSIYTKWWNGSVVKWAVKKVGEGFSCSGPIPDGLPGQFQFYDMWKFGRRNPITFLIWGDGQVMAGDIPEQGIYPYTSIGWVVWAPPEYVGGYVAVNGLAGNAAELGYEPAGLITLRIFKERYAPGLFDNEDYEGDNYDD